MLSDPVMGDARVAERERTLTMDLVPWMVAGVQTQYLHLRPELDRAGVTTKSFEVRPFRSGGWLERLPVPARGRGTLRSFMSVWPAQTAGVPDAVWTQVALPVMPLIFGPGAWSSSAVAFAIDCTPLQLGRFGKLYPRMATPASIKGRAQSSLLRAFYRRCDLILPWSRWAAESMITDYEAEPDRIHVLPPGIDLQKWAPAKERADTGSPARLLFVGGDFARKGGSLLLDLFRHDLNGHFELDLVTAEAIPAEPGIRVHRDLRANSDQLLQLYQRCDAVVVPTLADCFSLAAIEAMACAKPIIISDVGGISEIVDDGVTGHLVPPGDGRSLLQAITSLFSQADRLREMGLEGRAVAEQRFNVARQTSTLLQLVREASRLRREKSQLSSSSSPANRPT